MKTQLTVDELISKLEEIRDKNSGKLYVYYNDSDCYIHEVKSVIVSDNLDVIII